MKATYLLTISILYLLYFSLINSSFSWPIENGISVTTASMNQNFPELVADGSGGAIVTWYDERNFSITSFDIYAQRLSSSGSTLWGATDIPICTASGIQDFPQIISDDSGGSIITWRDNRSGNYDIYAQRISSSGSTLWTLNGKAICNASGDQHRPQLISDGSGGAIITWDDTRNGNSDIYAQYINNNGITQWALNGVAVCTVSGGQYNGKLVSDGGTGAIATWQDNRSVNPGFYGQRLNNSGNSVWTLNGLAISTSAGIQYFYSPQFIPDVIADDSGGAFISWNDNHLGNYDIFCQHIDSTGSFLWTTSGISVCTVTGHQQSPQFVKDGSGGVIVTWQDNRLGFYGQDEDIYAQRINSTGSTLWMDNGISVSTALNGQFTPQIISDSSGGAIISWWDTRNGFSNEDIYAQRIDSNGNQLWILNGLSICTETTNQESPQMIDNKSGEAIMVWMDLRIDNSYRDIFAQSVTFYGLIPITLSRFNIEQ